MNHVCEWDYYFGSTQTKVLKMVMCRKLVYISENYNVLTSLNLIEDQSLEEEDEEDDEDEEPDRVMIDETHARSNSFGPVEIVQQTNQTDALNLDLNPDLEY